LKDLSTKQKLIGVILTVKLVCTRTRQIKPIKLIQLKDLSTKQKLIAVILPVVIALLIFANVAALGILAAPQLIIYAAIIIAVALTIATLTLSLIGKRKLMFFKQTNLPFNTTKIKSKVQSQVNAQKNTKTPFPKIGKLQASPLKQETIQINKQITQKFFQPNPKKPEEQKNIENKSVKENIERDSAEQLYLSHKQTTVQMDKELENKTVAEPSIEKLKSAQQEAVREEKKGKLSCPICNKEFSQPMLMADYSVANQPTLVAHCPYCFQPLSSKQNNTTDKEAWAKYV
jgi:hypothetical protein